MNALAQEALRRCYDVPLGHYWKTNHRRKIIKL